MAYFIHPSHDRLNVCARLSEHDESEVFGARPDSAKPCRRIDHGLFASVHSASECEWTTSMGHFVLRVNCGFLCLWKSVNADTGDAMN